MTVDDQDQRDLRLEALGEATTVECVVCDDWGCEFCPAVDLDDAA